MRVYEDLGYYQCQFLSDMSLFDLMCFIRPMSKKGTNDDEQRQLVSSVRLVYSSIGLPS